MTESVQIAVIVAIPPTIAGVAAVIVALKTRDKIKALTIHINSRMDQLLLTTGQLSHSEGKAEGIAEERKK